MNVRAGLPSAEPVAELLVAANCAGWLQHFVVHKRGLLEDQLQRSRQVEAALPLRTMLRLNLTAGTEDLGYLLSFGAAFS